MNVCEKITISEHPSTKFVRLSIIAMVTWLSLINSNIQKFIATKINQCLMSEKSKWYQNKSLCGVNEFHLIEKNFLDFIIVYHIKSLL